MKSLSLNAKVAFIIGVFVIACTAISLVGINKMATINEALNEIVGRNAKRVALVLELQSRLRGITIEEKNFILEPSKEGMMAIRKDMDERIRRFQELSSEWHRVASE